MGGREGSIEGNGGVKNGKRGERGGMEGEWRGNGKRTMVEAR